MKRMTAKIAVMAMAVALAVSCNKEAAVAQPQDATSNTAYPCIRAEIDPETKTTVDGVKFAFKKGDGITVYNGADHAPVYYDCDSVANGIAIFNVASSTPNQPVEGMELIATYPRRSTSTGSYKDDGTLQILMPASHKSAGNGSFDPTAIPLVAYSNDPSGILNFKLTCGIVELTLKGDKKISQIVLESDEIIAGACTVGYKDQAPSVTMTGATKKATYTYSNVQLTSDGVKFYFGLPSGLSSDIKFTISDSEGGAMVKTAKGIKAERGEMIPTTLTYFPGSTAAAALESLWNTDPFEDSPLSTTSERYSLLETLETYCNSYEQDKFHAYLNMTDEEALAEEEDNSILACYRHAFDHVLSEVRSTTVENGSAVIWLLYNMGYIIKTPSVCFGIDVNHRYAAKLAPYLDFLCVTHSDADHIDNALMEAMDAAGKPVLSNFHSGEWMSKVATTCTIDGIKIATCISDESTTEKLCTTSYMFTLPKDAGYLTFFHEGDSSCDRTQLKDCLDGSDIDIMMLRFGQTCEAGLIGTDYGQATPSYVLFSHIEELRHNISVSPMRATIRGSISNMSRFTSTTANGCIFVPFWGEKMVWKNGTLKH